MIKFFGNYFEVTTQKGINIQYHFRGWIDRVSGKYKIERGGVVTYFAVQDDFGNLVQCR